MATSADTMINANKRPRLVAEKRTARFSVKQPVSITSVISPVDNWQDKYNKKLASRCGKMRCASCIFECGVAHPEVSQCPPCRHQPDVRADVVFEFQPETRLTRKDGPLQFSIAKKEEYTKTSHVIIPITCMVDGKPCNIVVGINVGSDDMSEFVLKLHSLWPRVFRSLAAWAFQRYGFGDVAIAELFSRAYEHMFDLIQLSKEDPDIRWKFTYEELEKVPAEDLSIANKVVLVAAWDGRLKVAGQLGVELVNHKLGGEKSLDVMCYGQPHTQVTVREGELCGDAVFFMVPGLDRDTLSTIAEQHLDDVKKMAEEVLDQAMEDVELAWVVKIGA